MAPEYLITDYFNYSDGDLPDNWTGDRFNISSSALLGNHTFGMGSPAPSVYGNDTFVSAPNWELSWRVRHDGMQGLPANTSWQKRIYFYFVPDMHVEFPAGISLKIAHTYSEGAVNRYYADLEDISDEGTMDVNDNDVPELIPVFTALEKGDGSWHTITLRKQDFHYSAYVDGNLIIEGDDEVQDVTSGYFGVAMTTYNAATFDNLTVRDLDYSSNVAEAISIATPYAFLAISIMSLALVIGVGTGIILVIDSQQVFPLIPLVLTGIGVFITLFIALAILSGFAGL